MSSTDHPVFYVGMQQTFAKVITEGEVALFAGLIGDNLPRAISEVNTSKPSPNLYISQFLMTGILSGILKNRISIGSSQFVSINFEFLAPIQVGDQIVIIVEVIGFDPQKHLTTYKTDCFDSNKNQVITGQVVLLVSE